MIAHKANVCLLLKVIWMGIGHEEERKEKKKNPKNHRSNDQKITPISNRGEITAGLNWNVFDSHGMSFASQIASINDANLLPLIHSLVRFSSLALNLNRSESFVRSLPVLVLILSFLSIFFGSCSARVALILGVMCWIWISWNVSWNVHRIDMHHWLPILTNDELTTSSIDAKFFFSSSFCVLFSLGYYCCCCCRPFRRSESK